MVAKTNFVHLLLALLCFSLVFIALAQDQKQTLNTANTRLWISGQPQQGEAQPQAGGAQQGQPQEGGAQMEQSAIQTGVAEGEDDDFEKTTPQSTNQDPFSDSKFFFKFNNYPTVQVDIMNGLPPNSPPLLAHCKSGNDDIGNHTLVRWHYFYWRFKPAVFSTTLFWCHLWWGSKHVKFEAYNKAVGLGQCKVTAKEANDPNYKETNVCHWQARADAIYFTPFIGIGQKQEDKRWIKKYDWGTENIGPVL